MKGIRDGSGERKIGSRFLTEVRRELFIHSMPFSRPKNRNGTDPSANLFVFPNYPLTSHCNKTISGARITWEQNKS